MVNNSKEATEQKEYDDEVHKEIGKIINQLETILKTQVYQSMTEDKKIKDIINDMEKIKSSLEKLGNKTDSISVLNERLEKIKTTIMECITKELDNRLTGFKEEIDQVIDMTAALTTELTSQLEEVRDQLKEVIEKQNTSEEKHSQIIKRINELEDKITTIVYSGIDGVRKQLKEEIERKLNNIESKIVSEKQSHQ
ncbi:MAG: hypothetical protein ACTSSJ_00040 [Candidatus Odinarchaeia archaeon]